MESNIVEDLVYALIVARRNNEHNAANIIIQTLNRHGIGLQFRDSGITWSRIVANKAA